MVVIEDETVIADVVRRYLVGGRFRRADPRDRAGRPRRRSAGTARPPIVLDIGLPDIDGLDVCRRLRAAGDWTPVIFVTARDEDVDRILGLEMGGDDYLVKPFNPRELVARVRAVLRRVGRSGCRAVTVWSGSGGVRIDRGSAGSGWIRRAGRSRQHCQDRLCGLSGTEIELTATEFDLLLYLVRNPGAGVRTVQPAQFGLGILRCGRRPDRGRARGGAARQAG